MTTTAICPACDETVILNTPPKLDQKVRCPHCRADLIVIKVEPVELDWADWDDDDTDDDDDDWDDDDN